MSINIVILGGYVGKDPETRTFEKGQVSNFSLATNEYYSGENHTTWHNIVVWGKTSEFVDKNIKKGSYIEVVGKIVNRTWTKNDGSTGRTNDIECTKISFAGKKSETNEPEKVSNRGVGDQDESDELPF
jgi:single-strand DNA-binding protein